MIAHPSSSGAAVNGRTTADPGAVWLSAPSVHDSMTSTVAPGFSRVVTTSETSATNRSIRPVAGRPGQNRPPGDLRLARPPGLLTLRVKRRAMQGEPRIPPQIRAMSG